MLTLLQTTLNPVQTTDVFRHDLDDIEELEPSLGARITRLQPDELEQALRVRSIEPLEIQERYERGDACYVGLVNGRPGHFSWVQTRGRHEISDAGISIPVAEDEVWIYHCHTAPWCRGLRLYPLALSTILLHARADGAKRAWIYTTRDNVSSRRGILRAGFKLDLSLRALRVGPRRILLASVQARAVAARVVQ